MNSTQETSAVQLLRADIARLSRENAAMREALEKARICVVTWSPCPDEPLADIDAALAQLDAPPAEEATDAPGPAHEEIFEKGLAMFGEAKAPPAEETIDFNPVMTFDDAHRQAKRLKTGLYAAPPAEEAPRQRCAATISTDPPQDCNWPFCGCDPKANKVLEIIEECGMLNPRAESSALAAARQTIAEAVGVMKPFAGAWNSALKAFDRPQTLAVIESVAKYYIDGSHLRAARAFVEAHGEKEGE